MLFLLVRLLMGGGPGGASRAIVARRRGAPRGNLVMTGEASARGAGRQSGAPRCGREGVDPLAPLMHQSPSRRYRPPPPGAIDEPRPAAPPRPGRQRGAREGLPGRPLDA